FQHPHPQSTAFFFTISFTIFNNLPLLFSCSSVSPSFLLSRSFALPITFFLSLLASRYACLLSLIFIVSFSLPDLLPSSLLTFSISIYSLRFLVTASSTSSFYHQDSLCLGGPFVFPHT